MTILGEIASLAQCRRLRRVSLAMTILVFCKDLMTQSALKMGFEAASKKNIERKE
jgi:hypothetical protein